MAIKIAISLTALSLIRIGIAEVWDRKGSAPLCRARPTGALPFYPSPLPHYRPMGRAWRGGSHILPHPQAIDANPTPNSLSWHGKTFGLLALEA